MIVGALFNRVFEVTLTSTIVSDFLCPVTIVGGDLRFAPVCLSVCLSARLSSFTVYSFQRVFLKPCILFVGYNENVHVEFCWR